MSNNVILYFEVHQPKRLKFYRLNEINKNHDYFWHEKNKEIFLRVSNSYIKTTRILMENNINASFSITGTLIEQAMEYNTRVIDAFDDYFKSGLGELLDETYYHSLSSIFDNDEFIEQINEHKKLMKDMFNIVPESFRNTELIYNDNISKTVKSLGYKNIITEGTDNLIKNYNPNYLYKSVSGLNLLLRNYRLSDDISFRFSNHGWNEFPLTADKYASWIKKTPGDFINLFMDYETFGEHQKEETGIFQFLKYLPLEFKKNNIKFIKINETSDFNDHGIISIDNTISWADTDRNLNPWLGNDMQKEAFDKLISLKNSKNKKLWRYFQTSDNLYYLSTGKPEDQEVHNYFNPYKSPYNAFLSYMNILDDFDYNYCK